MSYGFNDWAFVLLAIVFKSRNLFNSSKVSSPESISALVQLVPVSCASVFGVGAGGSAVHPVASIVSYGFNDWAFVLLAIVFKSRNLFNSSKVSSPES